MKKIPTTKQVRDQWAWNYPDYDNDKKYFDAWLEQVKAEAWNAKETMTMTDNRTNEPTEAQVEAAARAIADCHNPGMFEKYPENWRVEARAALAAADAHLPSVEQVQAEAWKEGYVAGFLKAMGGELDGSAREAVRLLTGFTDAELDELGGFEYCE